MNTKVMNGLQSLIHSNPMLYLAALFISAASFFSIGCGNQDKQRDQMAEILIFTGSQPQDNCDINTVPVYSPANGLKAGCNEYIFATYNQSVPVAGSYLTATFQNTGVGNDRHGISFPEPVNFAALGGTNASTGYGIQFDYQQGPQTIVAVAVTMRDGSNNLYSGNFVLSNGVSNIVLTSLIPVGAAPPLATVTAATEFSFTFINTMGAPATPQLRNIEITHLGTPVQTLATGLSKKTPSGNDISGFYIATPSLNVPLNLSPNPTTQTYELTRYSFDDGSLNPDFNNTVFSMVSGRLRVSPTVFPVPSQSDSNFLIGFPAKGKSLANANQLQIGMQRVGTFNMKIHFLPEYDASVSAANQRWFTIANYDQNNLPYAEAYSVLTLPVFGGMSAADQTAFTTLQPNMVGAGKVFIEIYNDAAGGNGYIDIGSVDLIP